MGEALCVKHHSKTVTSKTPTMLRHSQIDQKTPYAWKQNVDKWHSNPAQYSDQITLITERFSLKWMVPFYQSYGENPSLHALHWPAGS